MLNLVLDWCRATTPVERPLAMQVTPAELERELADDGLRSMA